jgi:hypothetical protein
MIIIFSIKAVLKYVSLSFSAKLLAAHNKGTARAKSLEELHDKLQAMRGNVFDHCLSAEL